MNKFTKSIGIVLAMLLLVNMFAFSSFAAAGDVALTLVADKTSYAAGDIVNLDIMVTTAAGVSGISGGEIDVAYNNTIFEPAVDIVAVPSLTAYGCTIDAEDTISGNYDATGSFIKPSECNYRADDVTNFGWNSGLYVVVANNPSNITYKDCSAGRKFITVPIKIKDGTPDGTYTIGINGSSFDDDGYCFLVDEDNGGLFGDGEMFTFGTVNITVGAAGPAVANGTTQVQWADKDAGKMNIAFRGIISDVDLTYAQGSTKELANITEVGVLFSKTDSELELSDVGTTAAKVESQSIYDYETGTYFYRAIVENVAYDNAETLYFRAYIVVDGTTYLAPATESTTATAQYTRATAAGMEAFGA